MPSFIISCFSARLEGRPVSSSVKAIAYESWIMEAMRMMPDTAHMTAYVTGS
ncbi:hypothetical protein D3C75_1299160 [compost metagenome]